MQTIHSLFFNQKEITMKNDSIKIEVQKTLACLEKTQRVKPTNSFFEKVKAKLTNKLY